MAPVTALSTTVWVLALLALLALAHVLYQVRGYRLLCNHHRRLRDLRAGQRQVYRGLEGLQGCYDVLLARVPHAVRPAPYATDDADAIALRTELLEGLAALRRKLRPLNVGPPPRLAPLPLLCNRYWRELRAARQELALAKSLRRELAEAERLVDRLEAVLARLAHKPLDVQRSYGDLQGMAEALSEEIELEQRAGTEGLAPLAFEAQAVRGAALEWTERLGSAGAAEAAQVAIEAEALRPQLLAKLSELYGRVGNVAGIHDQALRALERLDAALQSIEARLVGLRPGLAEGLQPALVALQERRQGLAARYGGRDVDAYQEVSRQAWALVAQARSLDRQNARLAEADQRATLAAQASSQSLEALRREMAEERTASRAQLDLSEAGLVRAERYMAQMQSLLAQGVGSGVVADPELIMAMLEEVETLAAVCRQEEEAARGNLAAWRSQRRKVEEALGRLENLTANHERLTRAWQDLQAFDRANWVQVEAGWYEAYLRERDDILAAAAVIRSQLVSGQAAQSAGGELQAGCELLDQRRQRLLHEGQRVTASLRQVRAAERQVQEGIAALRADVEAVAVVEQELPADVPAAVELRELGQRVLSGYRQLEDEGRLSARADLRRLRDEGIARLHEQLAMHRLSYAQLVESERTALKRQLALLWERWEPLSQRLAKAAPATDLDNQGLAKRWERLVQAARGSPASLKQVLDLQAQAKLLGQEIDGAEQGFQAEREMVRQAEVRLAAERRAAAQLRDSLPRLLGHAHPQVVDEEWERSTKAWRKAEALLRRLATQHSASVYLARLGEATALYQEARSRARSALVRFLRYSFLEDPEGMHQACLPMGRRWGRLGVTTREAHIRDLLNELEQAGQLGRLIERVASHFAGRRAPAS